MDSIILGLSVCLKPINLLSCFIGVLVGTLIGVLPGLGPVATMALLLPITFHLPPVSALIMLSGIFYGAQYGGSTTSILVNIPGEITSVVTTIDGYQMARQGRAGPALGIAAFGSFIAGTIAVIGLVVIGPPLANFALKFGPTEYCSLIILSFTLVGYLGGESLVKTLLMVVAGLLVGSVGQDVVTLQQRFVYGVKEFYDGISMVPILMGLFGSTEILLNVEKGLEQSVLASKIKGLLPTIQDWKRSFGAILRGSGIGFFLGLLPGGGVTLATFASYSCEKRLSKHPEEFGHGAIEGVAGPESANNAGAQANFVPLLCLGLPANAVMAILLGALMVHGVKVGPLLLSESPHIFWGVVTSMYVGNVMLLILNLPLIPMWVRILKIPYSILFPLILLFCLVGAYSVNNSLLDLVVMIVFGILGYLMRKNGYEPAPLVMGVILSPIFENAFRQSLALSQGSFSVFLTRPISLAFLVMTLAIACINIYSSYFKARSRSSG
jgi:putative tricarboxylic transport membrane protein